MKYKVVLSIDGGGIRGILSVRILLRLIDEIRKISRDTNTHLSDYVDYFAGTSTGGIVVSALTAPSVYNPSTPAFSVSDIQSFYLENAERIFSRSVKHQVSGLWGLRKSIYESKGLRDIMYSYFGGLRLSELLKPCTITSYNLYNNSNLFFRQQDARGTSDLDFYVRDVCLASSSAPFYFPPVRIRNITGDEFLCCDGGIFANNPSLCAYADIRSLDPDAYAKNMIFISLGNGWFNSSYDLSSFESAGGASNWYKALTNVFIGSVSESIDYQLKMIYRECPNLYFRWVPFLREGISIRIDTTNLEDLGLFIDCADAFVENNSHKIKELAVLLYNNRQKDMFDDHPELATSDITTKEALKTMATKKQATDIPAISPTWSSRYTDTARYPINYDSEDNLVELINNSIRINQDRFAFESFNQMLTFGQVGRHSDQIAGWLQKHALLSSGDRIAIFLPNILAFGPIFFGIIKAGLIPICCNPLYTSRELAHVLKDSGAKILFAFERSATVCQEAVNEYPLPVVRVKITDFFPLIPKMAITLGIRVKMGAADPWRLSTLSMKQILSAPDCGVPRTIKADPNDPALYQYTGGTTGKIKAAVLTHKNIISNVKQITAMFPKDYLRPDIQQIICTPLPLYHVFSLTVNLVACFHLGNHNVLIINPRNLPLVMKTLQKYRYNLITTVSTLLTAILKDPDLNSIDFSELRLCIAGAMPVPTPVAEEWYEKTKVRVIQGYGLTEASPVVSVNPYNIQEFNGGIGIPLPNTEIAIVDEHDNPVAPHESGELLVRGPQIMQGYLNQPEETEQVLTPDGWLRTGDIAKIDAQGYLYIVDRLKNMINVSGLKVFSVEVENEIIKHENVKEVGVIGVQNNDSEKVVACVVPNNPLSEDQKDAFRNDLKKLCEENLAAYKRPRDFIIMGDLPKTPVGKILHRKLRDKYSSII